MILIFKRSLPRANEIKNQRDKNVTYANVNLGR